jgi:membrane-associated phospholipid phosphatase
MNEVSSSASFQLLLTGLEWIRFIQGGASPVLTAAMKIITNLVSEFVFFGVVMILFWLAEERRAFRFGILVICSSWLNGLLKELFRQPRPFHLDSSLGMISESGYGFPSGHAQLVLIFLIPLAYWLCRSRRVGEEKGKGTIKKGLLWTAAVVLVLLVSFSRLYLGVHFPQDILGGWFLGGLSLVLYFLAERYFSRESAVKSGSGGMFHILLEKPRYQLILAAVIALLMNAPVHNNTSAAMFFGFSAGYILIKNRFHAGGAGLFPALLRVCIGFAGAVLLYLGLKTLFPGADSSLYRLFRFIRYALLGFWVSGIAPWIFLKLKACACKTA